MSTLHELRLTLDEHAERLHDSGHIDRTAAVHQRVRAVRRRRTAAVAIAAVVAIIATAVVTQTLRTPEDPVPAEQWHGVDVPTEVDLAAGTYDLDELRDMEPGEKVSFPYPEKLDRRAVALMAPGLGDGTATLLVNGNPVTRLVGDSELTPTFALWLNDLQIRLDGAPAGAQVGIATYNGPDTVFPEIHENDKLAASTTSDDSSAEITVTAALSELELAALCSSTTGEITMTVDDVAVVDAEACSQNFQLEDGSFSTEQLADNDRVEEHTIRVERTEPGVSVAAYVLGDGPEILGQQVAETVEYMGRSWTLDETIDQDGGALPLSAEITTTDEDRLVQFVNANGGAAATLTSGLGEPCEAISTQGLSDSCNPILLAGDVHQIEVTGYTLTTEAAILVYRPE